jgi:hypothetical protein
LGSAGKRFDRRELALKPWREPQKLSRGEIFEPRSIRRLA